MANVILNGVFMGAEPKQSTFEGVTKSSIQIDVYQPKAIGEKAVQVKSNDLSIITELNQEYSTGSLISMECSVNAYKNKAYYSLVQLLEVKELVKN